MTHQELKAIIEGGEYCIQCPIDYATNEKWMKYICSFYEPSSNIPDFYYSRIPFSDGTILYDDPQRKTILTLDEWWSVMDRAEYKKWENVTGWHRCYYKNSNGKSNCSDETSLPTQSVKVFIEELRGKQGVTYTERTIKHDDTATAWQPKEGEMVEVSDSDHGWVKRVYVGVLQGWNIVAIAKGDVPVGYKHIRPIQTITVSLDDLKAAYAEKHNIDVAKIIVAD